MLLVIWMLSNISRCDVIDPLSNHNLGTANEALKNQSTTNGTESLSPCSVCRYAAKSFNNVSKLMIFNLKKRIKFLKLFKKTPFRSTNSSVEKR